MAAVITSLNPDSAEIGGPPVTLHVIGTGFTNDAVINFNGGDEETTYVSATELTTLVKPSTATTPGSYPVKVVQADGESNAMPFAFANDFYFVEIVQKCIARCPEPEDCTLPTPWPPFVPPAAGA